MSETPTSRTQQHWAEAVAECVTDEQEALRLVGMYEEDEWPRAVLGIGRALLATRRALTAERAAREKAEAERDALRAEVERLPKALAEAWCLIGTYSASPPGSYARGFDSGVEAACRTVQAAIRAAKEGS